MDWHAQLMRHAADPADATTLALAGVLASAFEQHGWCACPIRGLGLHETRWLLTRWFPGAFPSLAPPPATVDEGAYAAGLSAPACYDEVEDLVALFREHVDTRAGTAEEARCVCCALACACLGDNHLWQDLRLPSRRELSALLVAWFPALAAKNIHDMKWKKFFYKQLCERDGLFVCRAPSCGVCADQALCFGPE